MVRAKDVCTGCAPALPLWLEDPHCAAMVLNSMVAFGDAVLSVSGSATCSTDVPG